MTTARDGAVPEMRYWDVAELDWEIQTPLSRRKILRLEDDLYVALVQWDAGFELPAVDTHGAEETVFVLDGTFVDQNRVSPAGSIIIGAAGSSHTPSTPDGVTFYVTRRLVPGERELIAPHWRGLPQTVSR